MSRKTAVIEEVEDEEFFDDDTDLPLPSLPNTGARGPILQELNVPLSPTPGPSPSPRQPPPRQPPPPPSIPSPVAGEPSTANNENITIDPVTGRKIIWVEDDSAYKHWTSIYPIYIDAKRPYKESERRVPRDKSIWWPLSSDIVEACGQLGLKTLHEPMKQHPRDWENPGRVKVCFKADGRLQNTLIKTKKQLLMSIATIVQRLNPDLVPGATEIPAPPAPEPSSTSKDKAKLQGHSRAASTLVHRATSRLPCPPAGTMSRISQYSPAQEANILIETVKAGMNSPAPGGAGPGAGEGSSSNNPAIPGGKGKRKVIRVRQ